MTTDTLRQNLAKLYVDRTVGDVNERNFNRRVAEQTVDLYRAVVGKRLDEGEDLVAEHHAISSHFRVTQSLLKEPEQIATSLFLTDRRLLHLRSVIYPGQPPTADARDGTTVDEVPFDSITDLKYHRQLRLGEAAVGAVLVAIGLLFGEALEFTAAVLVFLGGLGLFHAIFMPTRWVEVKTGEGSLETPVTVHAVKKKSARNLLRMLRERARKG